MYTAERSVVNTPCTTRFLRKIKNSKTKYVVYQNNELMYNSNEINANYSTVCIYELYCISDVIYYNSGVIH